MLELIGIFLSALVFGPVGGTAYAAAQGLSNLQIIVLITVIDALLVVFWFGIIGFGMRRIRRVRTYIESQRVAGPISVAGLGLVAAVNILVAVVDAYLIRAKKMWAWAAITAGGFSTGILWTLGALGIIQFLPSPYYLYIVAAGTSIAIVGWNIYRKGGKIRQQLKGGAGGG